MKKYLLKSFLSAVSALAVIMQLVTAVSAEELPVYKRTDAFAKGEQGADGWYFLYESENGEYGEMNWSGSSWSGADNARMDEHFIVPGRNIQAVLAWEAPYTGTVTLTEQDSTVYRNGPNPKGGDVTAALLLNNEILTDDSGNKTQWLFDNTCFNGTGGGRQSYKVSNLHVNKGDVLYHKVDCGANTTGSAIYWKPIVSYTNIAYSDTDITEFKMVDDIKVGDTQGYHGWHYMYKTAGGFADMSNKELTSETDGYKWSQGENWLNYFQVQPAYGRATAIGWQAPYSGTITLTRTGAFRRLTRGNGDVTTSILHNGEPVKQNDRTDAEWIFEKTENWETGPNREYEITGVKVNAGDWIYHVLDCGIYNSSPNIQWQPHIIYTEIKEGIIGSGTADDPYIISSIADYKEFAEIVNDTNPSACARLMTDIEWNFNTPQLESFSGTIDGNNHKITLKGKAMIKLAKDGAVIKNLTLIGTAKAENNAAALIESADAAGSGVTIKNCANIASVQATADNAAGFVGYAAEDSILNIKNSLNYGTVTSSGGTADAFVNAALSASVNCEGCYYLSESVKINQSETADSTFGHRAAAERFASGELAYKLNKRAGDLAFGQKIGEDAYPTGVSDSTKVVYKSGELYRNTNGMFAAIGEESAAFCADRAAFTAAADYADGRLVSVKAAEVGANSICRIELSPKAEDTERKLFVWESGENQIPLCETVTYDAAPEIPDGTSLMTVSFDGVETTCPIMIVDEYPSASVGDIARITGGTAHGNKLSVGDVSLEYFANERLAKYGEGHLMLESKPKLSDGKLFVPLSSLMPTIGWTVEYKRFENKIIIETGTNYPEPQVTFHVSDYETVTNDNDDAREAVVKAFKAAAASAESGVPTKLEFESGKTYRISEKQDSFALFDLDNLNNFTIEGNGCTLVFERPTNGLVNISGCTNIKVNNITVEYKERINIYGSVVSKNTDDNSINIVIPEDSPLPADEEWAQFYCTNSSDGPWVFGNFMNPEKDIPGFMPFDALMIKSVERAEGREYKVTFSDSFAKYDSSIMLGSRLVFKSRWNAYDFSESGKYDRPDFMMVTRSKDVTFDGIKTNGALLMLAPVSYCDGRIRFKNCEMLPKNGDLITSAADGIRASTNRFGVIVENCNLRNSFDDLINTEEFCAKVSVAIDEYTFETPRDMYYRVGDEIKFFDTQNHAVIGRAFLENVEKTDAGRYRLTLDRAVTGIVSEEESSVPTVMYNMNAANASNIIKNNTLANSRRHAYIIRSANSIIENNYMENNAGAATEAANEIHRGTNEGLFPSSLTFRNNVIEGEGISSKYTPLKMYSWNARSGEQKAIDGALIENNTINVKSVNGSIRINSVDGLYMLGNTIKNSGEFSTAPKPVTISNSNIAKIDGLDFEYKQNTSAVINISGSTVDESNITNINIIGGNTAIPYSIN